MDQRLSKIEKLIDNGIATRARNESSFVLDERVDRGKGQKEQNTHSQQEGDGHGKDNLEQSPEYEPQSKVVNGTEYIL